ILRDAMILGATCTKTYLSAKELGQVDLVIIDEASMVLLPMTWFAAGRAKERVVISGDPRQLPPIVPTRSQAIFDVLRQDVFTAADINLSEPEFRDPRVVMLEVQHRMHPDICELISQRMYDDRLSTDYTGHPLRPPKPYERSLTIIDTSTLWPFESVNAFYS